MVQDVEKKIIDLIKKSPLGVTSSEIARFLGINRVTITKYLAVIKQKAKIDFKEFGKAKMWYIPVDLNKVSFLREMLVGICQNVESNQLKPALDKTSKIIGKEISGLYQNFHKVERLTRLQMIDSVIDAMNKLGGSFSLVIEDEQRIILKNTICMYGKQIEKCHILYNTTLGIIKEIVTDNLGENIIQLNKTIPKDGEDIIEIYLKS
ncbi:MAG: methanogen output domain 1-containing protein [Nanoarchaeota archaeon]